LRLGEALKLSWDRPPVYLTLERNPYPQLLFFAEGQKSRQDEAVPMTPDLAAWLEQTPLGDRYGLVAPLPLETLPRVSDVVTAIGKAAGVVVNDDDKAASAHDLRRSFGARWARKIMPMDLMRLMRHKDISTTLKFYIGMTSSDLGRTLWGDGTVPKTVPKTTRKGRKAG
jgi:integrase